MKTAALFRVSTLLAARVNGAPAETAEALRLYGEAVGTAYQIYDDCLDLFGTEEKSGKTLGTDLQKGKLTLPVLHLIQQLDSGGLEELTRTLLHGGGPDPEQLRARVVEAGGHVYAVRKAQELLDRAARALESLPGQNESRSLLVAFAREFGARLQDLTR